MIYDCVIVGGGPAGLTAGLYLARANKKVLCVERLVPGGQVAEIAKIENYPGFAEVSGSDLAVNMFKQAKSFGVEFLYEEVLDYDFEKDIKTIKTNKRELEARTIILAMGSISKDLNVRNEKQFIGRGVSYCATCDGNFFKGKDVAVVGEDKQAISSAKYLSSLCRKVFLLSKENGTEFSEENIENYANTRVTELIGENKVEGVKIDKDGELSSLAVEGVFVAIGRTPPTEKLVGKIELDTAGYIIADDEMKTSIDGVFVAGDIVSKSLKQIVIASASGAVAGTSVIKFLMKK